MSRVISVPYGYAILSYSTNAKGFVKTKKSLMKSSVGHKEAKIRKKSSPAGLVHDQERFRPLPSCITFAGESADADVDTDGACIIILEIAKVQAASGRDLERDALAGTASVADDSVVIACCDGRDGNINASRSGSVGVGGALSGRAGELLEVKTTSTRNSVRRSDEVLLLREEEDHSASLTSITRRNVEVEDG